MRQNSAERRTTPPADSVVLENGDHLDQKTFHELYERTPKGFKAELIGGVVYVASPTWFRHGRPHLRVATWAGLYMAETEGVDGCIGTTTILGDESEVEPDLALFLAPELGGKVVIVDEGYLQGPPELAIEIANSSAAIDLNAKRLDYERAGVREYVVLLVKQKEVRWFVRGKSGFAPLKPIDGVFRSRVFPGLWLDPVGVFEPRSPQLTDTLRAGLATPAHAAFVAKLAKRAKKAPPPAAGE